MLTLFHLQAHGHGLQMLHPLIQILGAYSKMEGHHGTNN